MPSQDKQADQPDGQYLDPDEDGISDAERTARQDARRQVEKNNPDARQA